MSSGDEGVYLMYTTEEHGQRCQWLAEATVKVSYTTNALPQKITYASQLSGAFEVVARLQCHRIAPSRQLQNPSEICDLSVNIYYGTGSKIIDKQVIAFQNLWLILCVEF